MSYTSYIKRVLSCDFQITSENGNINGGGRILKENCLLLQFTSISSYSIDARITKPICMIPLCIQMVATYLKFFYYFQFWNNSDLNDFTQKCNFSRNLSRNWFKFFKCMGGCHIHHISNGFYRVTFRSPPKMEI